MALIQKKLYSTNGTAVSTANAARQPLPRFGGTAAASRHPSHPHLEQRQRDGPEGVHSWVHVVVGHPPERHKQGALCKQAQQQQRLQVVADAAAGRAVVRQARAAGQNARLVAQSGACGAGGAVVTAAAIVS